MSKRRVTNLHGVQWRERLDATDTIRIGPLRPSDFNAKACSPSSCVLANAINRNRKVNGREIIAVWVGARIVDVQFKDDPECLVRYVLSNEDAKRVATFDQHPDAVKAIGTWAKDITITLVPPTKSARLDAPKVQGKNSGKGNSAPRRAPMRHLYAEAV